MTGRGVMVGTDLDPRRKQVVEGRRAEVGRDAGEKGPDRLSALVAAGGDSTVLRARRPGGVIREKGGQAVGVVRSVTEFGIAVEEGVDLPLRLEAIDPLF